MKSIPVIGIIIWLAIIVGWGLNVYKLSQLDFESNYKAEIFRVVGLLPPLGAVIGWIEFEEEVQLTD
jgi:hypothetical protein